MIRKPVPVEAPIQNLNLKEDKSDRFYVGLVLIGGGIILESIATKEEGNTKSTFEFMGGAFGIFGLGIGMSFTF